MIPSSTYMLLLAGSSGSSWSFSSSSACPCSFRCTSTSAGSSCGSSKSEFWYVDVAAIRSFIALKAVCKCWSIVKPEKTPNNGYLLAPSSGQSSHSTGARFKSEPSIMFK
ncbi:hypothetical protein KL930_000048 [Ogataea haglerorum]|nr:hypothetical protein KL922_002751 [Ogataea haglerorum]KAG7782714.1 hypothetical protein KL930_000048 [Ogataea haglerorum]